MAPPEQSKAQGLGDDEDVELVPDNCAASCVTCGQDPTSTNWPIASSLSCLVGAGCVVLPPDDMDDETLLRKRSDGTRRGRRPVSREAAPTRERAAPPAPATGAVLSFHAHDPSIDHIVGYPVGDWAQTAVRLLLRLRGRSASRVVAAVRH